MSNEEQLSVIEADQSGTTILGSDHYQIARIQPISAINQIKGVHVKPFLGIEPTGNRVFMRDCDWWRCSNGKVVENWCMLDTLHLALQLGPDVISEVQANQINNKKLTKKKPRQQKSISYTPILL